MMDSNVRHEEDMRGFPTEEIERSETLEQRGQRRRREHDGTETHQQNENENEIDTNCRVEQ